MVETDVMTEAQAAASLRVHPKTLARWRQAGHVNYDRTPTGRIRYRWSDLVALRRQMRMLQQVPVCSTKLGEDAASVA